jgi:hypothetical protein
MVYANEFISLQGYTWSTAKLSPDRKVSRVLGAGVYVTFVSPQVLSVTNILCESEL